MKARIALAINEWGEWFAYGGSDFKDADSQEETSNNISLDGNVSYFWIDAEIPVPATATITGKVQHCKDEHHEQ